MSTIYVNNILPTTGDTTTVSGSFKVTGSAQITGSLHVSGNLTVDGTTTTVNSTTVYVTSSITFEGPADAHETTLGVVAPTADATVNLPAMSAGTYYLPVLAAASTTAVSSTPEELNLLDGSSAGTVVNSKGVIYSSAGAVHTSIVDGGTTIALSGATDVRVENDLRLDSDSSALSFGLHDDFTLHHDGTTGGKIYGAPVHVSSSGDLILDSNLKITLSASAVRVEDNLYLDTDGSVLSFGADGEITLTHEADVGLILEGNGQSADPTLTIKNTNADATGGSLKFLKDGSSVADADVIGNITFVSEDDGSAAHTYASIIGSISDMTAGTEGGKLQFNVAEHDGTVTQGLLLADGDADGEIDVTIGAGAASVTTITGTSLFSGNATFGVDDTGVDVRFFSATTNEGILYDASEDELGLLLTTKLSFHDIGGGENILASSNGHLEVNAGTTLDMTAPTTEIHASTVTTIDSPIVSVESSTSARPRVIIKNTTNDANAGVLRFVKDKGAAGAADDNVGVIEFYGDNAAQEQILFGRIRTRVAVHTDGDEGGKMHLSVASHDGGLNHGLVLTDGSADNEVDVTIGNGAASVVTVPGVLNVANDIILDDGGSLKEAGGTAAFTFDGSGNVTKIGQDSPSSGEFLKYDGSKWVADSASSGGAVSAVANGADNRIATFSSSDALNGEANLTFDGSTLTLAGDLAATSDTATFTSANSQDPLIVIKNTTNDANSARLQFVKDKGAAGADGDDIGVIEFVGDDAAQTQTTFAKILAEVSEADNTDEAGKLSFFVAESDGTDTALTAGLILEGEHATDGQVDATIGAGAASTTTVAGDLAVTSDATIGDDLSLTSDSAVFNMGAGNDFTITHDGTTGATLAGNPIIVDSGGNLTLDAHTGIFLFKDAGSEVLRFTEGNSGDVTVKLAVNGKDLIFTDNGDAEGFRILDAAAGVKVPGEVRTTGIAFTDGDDAITIADGGGVTFSDTVKLVDDKTLTFGSNDDVTIEYDEDGTDALLITGDTFTYASANASDPLIQIFNSTDDANGGRLRFVKNRGTGAGQDDDVIGVLEFVSHDDASADHLFAEIKAQIADASNGAEGGKLSLGVVTHDGETQYGLVLQDGDAEDEIDATIGNGAASMTTVSGDLTVTGADIVIGADADGTDRTVVFGHTTLKTIMGIDDSADTFILNTDDAFDSTVANNSLSIDANHKMIVGGSLRAKGYVAMTYHQYAIGSSGERWVPWYDKGDLALGSATELVQAVAPMDGRLVRVIFRPESEQSGGDTVITLYKAVNGTDHMDSTRTYLEESSVTCSGNASTSNVFNFSGSAHFSAGDVYGFTINPHKNPGEVNVTCVWEFDTSAL